MTNSLPRLMLAVSFACAMAIGGCATHGTSVGAKIDDSAITTKVKASLLKDPGVSGQQVSVDTVDGVVQLSGFVESKEAAARAVEIARSTNGVRNVQNRITVR